MDTKKIESLARQKGRAFKVLIVDDEPRVRDIFKQFCEITGSVEVDMAENGSEAVEKVRESDYDLVTMDLIMPEMSGVEAVTKIKEIKPHLPVIVITGNATESLVRQAGVKGANSLMYKPVMMENFVDEVVLTFEKSVAIR
ncbi:MAG TPA: response regulator [candidate division Zixibacteria bacterium]|nr:response regulator [candidate division Zixibacteria bacterium]